MRMRSTKTAAEIPTHEILGPGSTEFGHFFSSSLDRPLRSVADLSVGTQSLEVDDSKPACQALDIDAGVHLAQREGVAKHETAASKCVLGDSGFDQGCLGRFELG